VLDLCSKYMFDVDVMHCALAIKLQTHLSKHVKNDTSLHQSLKEEALEAIDSLFLVMFPLDEETSSSKVQALNVVLSTLEQFSDDERGVTEANLYEIFFNFVFEEGNTSICSDVGCILLETLAAISTKSKFPNHLAKYRKDIKVHLENVCNENSISTKNKAKATIFLFILSCICDLGDRSNSSISMISKIIIPSKQTSWTLYRIARQALRLGQSEAAYTLLDKISDHCGGEQQYFWITGLQQIAEAEMHISNCFKQETKHIEHKTNEAAKYFNQAIFTIMAGVTPSRSLNFQVEFVKFRNETLQLYSHVINVCHFIINFSPQHDEECLKAKKLRQCIEKFNKIEKSYDQLRSRSFDCDPSTLDTIKILQHTCSLMAIVIDSLLQAPTDKTFLEDEIKSRFSEVSKSRENLFSKTLFLAFKKICDKANNVLFNKHNKHLDKLTCLIECCSILLSTPFSYPRYFFQNQQHTSVNMSLNPSSRSFEEPYKLDVQRKLTLKIDGLINRCDKSSQHEGNNLTLKRFREVKKIKLLLNVYKLEEKRAQKKVQSKIVEHCQTLEKTSEPHNDYFHIQFILSFKNTGNHQIDLQILLMDESGCWWNSNVEKESIFVRTSDEQARINLQIQQQNNLRMQANRR